MTEAVRFSFALSQRMQAFIELRNGLQCLQRASAQGNGLAWLCAASDIRASLIGDQGRRPALAEIVGLLVSMQAHLQGLGKEYPRFAQTIAKACDKLDAHMHGLQDGLAEPLDWLYNDALVFTYLNALKKQDWLGHKPALPQCLDALWHPDDARARALSQGLAPLAEAVQSLDHMLHEYVAWEQRQAVDGIDQVSPDKGINYGLLVIGMEPETVARGITPDISGNRVAVRIRFQQWPPGKPAQDVTDTVSYAMMLVPFA